MVTAPSLPELKEHLGNALRHRVRLLGFPVQSRELDLLLKTSENAGKNKTLTLSLMLVSKALLYY